ncbi:MAG: hypothetical protein ACM3MJ_01225 [Deltaproteobacteria bacterium]
MASTSRLRTIGKASGVAAATAPYVRRLARDEELRDDVSDFIRTANDLMTRVRSDKRLQDDVRRMMESAQSGAGRLRGDLRPRHTLRTFFIGTGLILTSIGVGIAVAWPRTRRQITQAVGQGTSRANAVVHDVRERVSGQGSEMRAA